MVETEGRVRSLLRGMVQAEDGFPGCAPSARGLGVRSGRDIPVGVLGKVRPESGGMSVAPDDPRRLPPHRRPPSLGGWGRDPVFELSAGSLGESLSWRPESGSHGVVEPAFVMFLDELQEVLCDSRLRWSVLA
jgi:hypothetical protein